MFALESYAAVRRFVFVEGHSRREAAKVFGLSRDTVAKMCAFSLPPGYRRAKPPEKPKLGPLLPVIDAMLREDRAMVGVRDGAAFVGVLTPAGVHRALRAALAE